MKFVCYTTPTEKGLLLEYPSESIKAGILHQWNSGKEKYKGYMTVELKNPYKSRTTGKGSQNNLFWKLVQYITDETGEDPQEIERTLKMKAVGRGYPYHTSKISGQPVPESMTKINTVEMSYLIDTAYEVIAFLGINLAPEDKQASVLPQITLPEGSAELVEKAIQDAEEKIKEDYDIF